MIVDSCRAPSDSAPAPIRYLESIGVDPKQAVRFVVATHWDKDHVSGIADVVKAASRAHFVCAGAFLTNEFQTFIESYCLGKSERGVSDIRAAFEALRGRKVLKAGPGRLLQRRVAGGDGATHNLSIISLSPSDAEYDLFLMELAALIPGPFEDMRTAVARSPNLASVVLGLQWDDVSVLLGADMESVVALDRGWNAAADVSKSVSFSDASLVKIPHHGSLNGHHARMWSEIMQPSPVGVIAPFGKGGVASRPPKESDLERISRFTSKLFVTARHASARPRARLPSVDRGLKESRIHTTRISRSLGLVRLRRAPASEWAMETFGDAFEYA